MIIHIFLTVQILLKFVHPNQDIPRYEPYKLFQSRNKFIKENFPSFSSVVTLSENPPYKCFATKKIEKNTEIFSFPKDSILSSDGYLPFKENLTNFLNDKISLNTNVAKKFLLSLHILFSMKSNITDTLIEIKRTKNEKELNSYKQYLKSRLQKAFINNYMNNLPLSNSPNQIAFSSEHISDYKISGIHSPYQAIVKTVYESLVKNANKIYNSWLNTQNNNLFYSIFQFVSTNSFYNNNDESKILIFPFVKVCSHSYTKKRITFKEEKEKFSLFVDDKYEEGEEFSFAYSDDLSNDNLVLNYGFIHVNNTNHNFLFKFEIVDHKYLFYKYLLAQGFDEKSIKLLENEKISATFYLNSMVLNENLVKFVFLYSEYVNKDTKQKVSQNQRSFTAYFLYYSTIYKNALGILDSLPLPNNTDSSFVNYVNEIRKIEKEISNLTQKVSSLNNGTFVDNYQNLFYYNKLHYFLIMKNTHVLNLENLMILLKHEDFVYQEIVDNQWDMIKSLKKRYI